MKQISLSKAQEKELQATLNGKNLSGRYLKRLQGVDLNARGYSINDISELLGVHYNSVRHWLKRYEEGGLEALADSPREGRPRLLSEAQEQQVLTWVDEEPRHLKKVLARVRKAFEVDISLDTLKRILKRGATATGG